MGESTTKPIYTAFLDEALSRAESLFSYIDKKIKPQMFLVSVISTPDFGQRVSLFTKGDTWISEADFAEYPKVFEKIFADAQSGKKKSLRKINSQALDLKKICMRESVFKIFESAEKKPAGLSFFISEAATVEDEDFFVVLAVGSDDLDKYPSIEVSASDSDIYLSPSFMASLIDEFLEKHRIELDMHAADFLSSGFHFGLDSIIQQAGRNFVGDIAYRVSGKPQPSWNEHIFSVCTEISRTHYELAEACGSIMLAPKDVVIEPHAVRFSANPKLGDVRSTRKLLELTKDGMALHSDSETIFGLCRPPKRLSKSYIRFDIEFLGKHKWQISYLGKPLITVSYGIPRPPSSPFEAAEFADALKKVFGFKSPRKIERLVEIIQVAMREKKGTLLVFSKKAKDEAKRLSSQSTLIAPIALNKQLLLSLTPIDGALMIDQNGICYSIGTILDGMVTQNGDSGRGARYNSAVKYIDYRKALGETCMAVVVSEDANVDIVT